MRRHVTERRHSSTDADSRRSLPKTVNAHPRRGAISAMVIVVLVLLAALAASQVRRVVIERRQMKTEIEYLQTHQAAEAGLLRASLTRKQHQDYRGETWEIPAGVIHKTKSAQVLIRLDDNGQCLVTARYPSNSETPLQVTRSGSISNE